MAITDWPQSERPREKLLRRGPGSLSDAEVLAILLRQGTRGASAVDLARSLLVQFGTLRAIVDAPQRRLCEIPGLGTARYAELQACLELGRRYLEGKLVRGRSFYTPEDTRDYLILQLQRYEHEVFSCLFLDNRHRLIRFEEMFRGTIDGASVHVREVASRALSLNAAAVIVAHNHPSGVAEPSAADRAITARLKSALGLIDVRMLDHFIVGDGEATSLASMGLI